MSEPLRIGRTVADSNPWWDDSADRLASAPNIVVILLDDTGWSDLGCFGSEIDTPTFDALARDGIRYNNFHVTPLCSPTRASLLTGRDQHRVGMRFLADTDTGFPNTRGRVDPDVPMLAEILREAGYGTYLVGKWHLAPLKEITPAGPTRNWPAARGYDKYYGFLDGCTDHYSPELFADNHQVQPPSDPNYRLTTDLVDHAITFVRDHRTFRPRVPFFLHLALGATHAPFPSPREYVEKYQPVFAKGWDQTRLDRFNRQMELGLVPPETELTPRNPGVPDWDNLDPDEQEINAWHQAAFAGFLHDTDVQVSRLMAELEALGLREDTIVVVFSDNGASHEGGTGDVDCNAAYSRVTRSACDQLKLTDRVGGPRGQSHYASGWAMAGNTPFRRYKQYLDLGGVRSPLIVSWPGKQADFGGVNPSYLHVVDLFPTLLDAAGVRFDTTSLDGASALAAVTDARACVGRTEQAFEMFGHRAIYRDGWMAVTEHVPGVPFEDDVWRLYDTASDFSQAHDRVANEPQLAEDMIRGWWKHAEQLDFYPLDDRTMVQMLDEVRNGGLLDMDAFDLRPGQGHVPFAAGVTGSNRSMSVTAELNDFHDGDEGVIIASGNIANGYTLYIQDRFLVFEHRFLGQNVMARSRNPVPEGTTTVALAVVVAEDRTAKATLLVGGSPVSHTMIPVVSAHLSFYGMDVGHDPVSQVSPAYEGPFPFTADVLDVVHIRFLSEPDILDLAQLRAGDD